MAPKASVCVAVWNTAHLFKRTLYTLAQQTFKDFELIVIDDFSEDDVPAALEPYLDKLNIRYVRLTHSLGMRGNTVSFNTAFDMAEGEYLVENTPEIMWYPDTLRDLIDAIEELGPEKAWVSVRTYNLTPEDQLVIDTVDWKSDVRLLETLPNFQDAWTQNNTKQEFFGTHQTCIIRREDWFTYMKRFPYFLGYGSDDPWYAGQRGRQGFKSATIKPFVYHTWHPPINFWMAKGKAPNWNRFGHTMQNHYNDGHVPPGGTCDIWDGGSHEKLSFEECLRWSEEWDDRVLASGYRRKDGEGF